MAHQRKLAFELYLAKQAARQTGAQEKWNRAIADCGAEPEIIMLDVISTGGEVCENP